MHPSTLIGKVCSDSDEQTGHVQRARALDARPQMNGLCSTLSSQGAQITAEEAVGSCENRRPVNEYKGTVVPRYTWAAAQEPVVVMTARTGPVHANGSIFLTED